MAGETSSMDFGDPRLQYTSGPNQFEPVNTRPRASSNVRGDGYWPEQSRFGHSQQPMGDAAPSAFPQAEPPNQVPPELIAQITANVINQLKTTGIEPVSPKPPANARYQPPPPPPSSSAAQWPGPLSPSSDPVSSPPPYPPHSHSPPSPYKQADVARAGSPQSQGPILQPESTNSREQFGASPQDRREAAPLNQNGESGHTRPKGPMRLSTGQEETTLEKIWGQLFDEECNPTVRLGQLLRGLAVHIVSHPSCLH